MVLTPGILSILPFSATASISTVNHHRVNSDFIRPRNCPPMAFTIEIPPALSQQSSSAEVYGWGALSPIPGEEYPTPLEAGRSKLVRKVYAGSGCAILEGSGSAKWLRDRAPVGSDSNTTEVRDDPWTLSGLRGAAFGQCHTLLLRKTPAGDGPWNTAPVTTASETQVLALGLGRQGQLGLGASTYETKQPQLIRALSAYHIVQLACGANHSAAVTSFGDLFTWGRGVEGQLGHASPHLSKDLNESISCVQFRPKPVSAFLSTKKRSRPVTDVSCGHNFTVVATRTGEIWSFGEGAMGQLGIGRVTRAMVPTLVMTACRVTGEPFVQVAAGWAHALARTRLGGVSSWGFNALGSLGLGDRRTRFFPEAVEFSSGAASPVEYGDVDTGCEGGHISTSDINRVAIAVAKVHACGNCSGVLTLQGKLFTWGYDMAGRLGHGRRYGCLSQPEKEAVCVPRPRRVERLANSIVADFALSGKGGIALVPLHVKAIEPRSGPLEDGCRIVIDGDAFWDSPDIVVKFTPITKRHKPLAARSAIGAYATYDGGVGDNDVFRNGNERVTCTTPRFVSPDEVFVEVSIDGRSYSGDDCRFQYYRTPDMKEVTPNPSRPPLSRLRFDGDNIRPNASMVVRFEEDVEMEHEVGTEGLVLGDDSDEISPLALRPSRIFEFPAKAEFEIIQGGIDTETELPIEEERWFITCEAPGLGAGMNLPFISRVTLAPNGVTFRGTLLRFILHDPFVDACAPTAVPVPDSVPASAEGDEEEFGVKEASVIYITGRNLYLGAGLAVRLCPVGHDRDGSSVPLDAVTFNHQTKTITSTVPAAAGRLLAREAAPDGTEIAPCLATRVVVEVSMDGKDYFAVPDMLTLYRYPRLTLKGDGFFVASGGGLAELMLREPAFRGHNPKVRLLSEIFGIDITLPLLSSPPLQEIESGKELSSGALGDERGQVKAPTPGTSARDVQAPPPRRAEGDIAPGDSNAGEENDDNAILDESVSKIVHIPVSAESFFFVVPPFPKNRRGSTGGDLPPGRCNRLDGIDPPTNLGDSARIAGGKPSDAGMPRVEGAGDAHEEPLEESTFPLSVFVSLNGSDWQPACGPSLTYFCPPPEPVEPDPLERKHTKKKKR